MLNPHALHRALFALVIALGVALSPRTSVAQAKPMTITSFDGLTAVSTYQVYDEDGNPTYTQKLYFLRFTVKNTSTVSLYLFPTATCQCAPGSAAISPTPVGPLNPGEARSLDVTFAAMSYQSGTVYAQLTATGEVGLYPYVYNQYTYQYQPSGYQVQNPPDMYTVPITLVNGAATGPLTLAAYRPAVTPKSGTETVPFGTTLSRAFAVTNAGSQTATYSLTASCVYLGSCVASKATTTLAPNATDSVSVSFPTPNGTSAPGTVRLIATYTDATNHAIADTGSRSIVTPSIRPTVGPKDLPTVVVSGPRAFTFEVRGINQPTDVSLAPLCTQWLINCSTDPLTVDPSDPSVFQAIVRFTVPPTVGSATAPLANAGVIARVMSAGQVVAADTAGFPLALPYAKPVVAPKTKSETDPPGSARSFAVSVVNSGNVEASYTIAASCTNVANCAVTTPSLWEEPGVTRLATVTFTAPPIGVTGSIRLVATRDGYQEADTATLTVTGADVVAPTFVSLNAPTESSTISTGALSIALTACDSDGTLAPPTATLNGAAMTANMSAASSAGCRTASSGTLTGTAQPGANTVIISLSDGVHTTTRVVHFTYDDAAEAQPIITTSVSSELLRGGQQWVDTFSVRNAGPLTALYSLAFSCPSGASSCTAGQSTLTVAPGQTGKAWVSYSAPSVGTQGTVSLTATYVGATRTVTATKSIAVQLDQVAPTVVVTGLAPNATISVLPTFAVAWCDADGTIASHTVKLDGVPLTDNYASTTQSGCVTAATSSWTNLPVTLGAHAIVATAIDAVGHATTNTLSFTFSLPALSEFQPRVTPRAAPVYLVPNQQTLAFAVRNAGTRSAQYQITPQCAAVIAAGGCQVDKPSTMLAAGQTDTVRLSFSVPTLPASPATFKLIASYQDLASRTIADTGVVVAQIPTFAQLYQPQIPADPTTHVQQPGMITTYSVPITNLGMAPVTYHMSFSFTGGFTTQPWLMVDSLHVEAGQTATYIVQPVAPSTNGTSGTAYVSASYATADGSVWASVTMNFVTGSTTSPGSVTVSPHAIRRPVAANTVALDTFVVTNTGSAAAKFSYAVTCTGAALSCLPSAGDSTPLLQPQQTFAVPVRYIAGSTPGTLGTVKLHAVSSSNSSIFDDGVITDSVVTSMPVTVVTRGVSGGANLVREQCLTISAGDAAAYECGDLRLAHALPGTTTLNTTRAPTLVYNNRHQSGIVIVPAEVRLTSAPAGATITATVTIKGQLPDSARFTWSAAQSDGLPRRIAVPVNIRAKGLGTGAYEYTFQVRATIGGATSSSVVTDTLTVINRATTQFGPGWWLDGFEQLFVVDATHRLWVGGDGSTRLYTRQSDTTWLVSPRLDRVDSLTANASQTTWVRHLRNGATVEFNAAGQHAATTNALGHRTRFVYNATNAALLDSIVLPVPAGGISRSYAITHDVATGYVTRIDAPATPGQSRRTSIGYTQPHGQWLVTSITDPDLSSVVFGYDASDRIATRTNRRGVATTYAYDEAQGLKRSKLMVGADSIVHTFCAAETSSLTWCASGGIRSDSVRSWVDGPRDVGDTTWFKLTPYGAPAVITDALHQVTTVERGDTLWPLLPTKVTQPTGHQVKTSYDAVRGLARVVTDVAPYGGADAVTSYDWDAKWDAVTLAVMPQGGGSARSFYDATTGLKQWQEDGRGSTTRVNFAYTATRQVQTVTTPGNSASAVNRVDYDALGNTWKLTTPSGIVTEALKDAVGRDTLTKTPTDPAQTESLKLLQRFVYNASGSDSVSLQWNGADSLRITNLYDAEGNLTEVSQRGAPDAGAVGTVIRRFMYDEADRKTSERLVHGASNVEEEVLQFTYDVAGNLITGGRDAFGATLTYDVLNRLIGRNGTNLATFTYDALGMRTANNPAAQISRSYYPNGALKTDTLRIAKADWSTDFSAHVYGLAYTYDLAGHKIGLDHPSQLASGTTAHTSYAYDATSGLMTSLTDKFGQTFTYHYDDAGRLDQQVWRAGNSPLTEVRSYDVDSRLARRTLRMADNTVVHDDSLRYDSRDKVAKVLRLLEVGAVVDTFTFDVRGRTTTSVLGSTTETTQFDAYGNALQSNTRQARPGATWSSYERGSGRLQYRMGYGDLATVDTTAYDTDFQGNQYHTLKLAAHGPFSASNGTQYTYLTLRTETQDTYDDRSKLVSHTITLDTLFQTTTAYNPVSAVAGPSQYVGTELYRYDALGRRIWARSIKGANCNSSSGSPQKWTGCHNTLTRTVWDGNQVLYEIRADGSPNASSLTLEDDGSAGADYGVVGYVHGYGIDEPVAVDKNSIKVIPFADWRGHFDGGLCGTAVCTSAQVKFPQRTLFGAANSIANAPAPSWYGSLIEGQEDASGYLYRRNRYFDPSAGRFTQEDPIGLAGGLNLYGFGGGDAVNFSDPFGLCFWDACAAEGYATAMAAAGLAAIVTAAYVILRDRFA